MIYFVTGGRRLDPSPLYKYATVEESLKLLEPLKVVGLDTETSGLNCHDDRLLSLQLGCFDFQVVIDCLTVNILQYKEYLESDRLFIFWNAKFDLKWLYRYHIVPKKVYDGYLAEKVMWLGYPMKLSPEIWEKIKCDRYDYVTPKKKNEKSQYILRMSLQKAGEMYLGIELDKSIRGQIIYSGLTDSVIEYAAKDVQYLEKIKDIQEDKLKEKGLSVAMDYLNRFILALAYMEFCGIKLDPERWKRKIASDNKALEDCRKQLDEWLIENMPDSKYIVVNNQGNLFTGFDLNPKVTLNWRSAKQVIPIFKKFGVNVEVQDRKSDENKDSIDAKVLEPQKDKCSLIPIYLKFKELEKLRSTYGENFLEQINKTTGRLYTNYSPLGTDTCRISSGGKDKSAKIEYVNMLNLPSDEETRACFVSEPGNKFISIDYSG